MQANAANATKDHIVTESLSRLDNSLKMIVLET